MEHNEIGKTIMFPKILSLAKTFLVIAIAILIFSYLLYKCIVSYLFMFFLGIVFTLSLQFLLVSFLLGFKLSSVELPQELTISPNNNAEINPHEWEEIDNAIPQEENSSDLKILYKTISKKSPNENQAKLEKNFISMPPLGRIFHIDQNYYCYCKFSKENLCQIISMKTEIHQSHVQTFVKYFNDASWYFKQLGLSFKKAFNTNCLLVEENSNNFLINLKSYTKKYNDFLSHYCTVHVKFTEMSEFIGNVIISNVNGIFFQSMNELKVINTSMNALIKVLTDKEREMQMITDKYINNKKLLERLSQSHENSKLKNEKFESVVKYEMELKIATKELNETQAMLASSADEYHELKEKFSKKSLKLYIEFLKIITRESEVIKALVLSFFEAMQDCLEYVIGKKKFIFENSNSSNMADMSVSQVNVSNLIQDLTEYLITAASQDDDKIKQLQTKFQVAFQQVKEYRNLEYLAKFSNILKQLKQMANVLYGFADEIRMMIQKESVSLENNSNKFLNVLHDIASLPSISTNVENGTAEVEPSLFSISKEFFTSTCSSISAYLRCIEAFNQEYSVNDNLLGEKIRNIKEEYSLSCRKLESLIAYVMKQKLLTSKFIEYVYKESMQLISLLEKTEIQQNEVHSILCTTFNIFQSAILTVDSDIISQGRAYVRKMMNVIENSNLVTNPEGGGYKNLINEEFEDENFEKVRKELNSEIVEFFSLYGSEYKFKILHERKCVMYQDKTDYPLSANSSSDINFTHNNADTQKNTGYFYKIKDYLFKTFKKTSEQSKQNLFHNIDQIIGDKNPGGYYFDEKNYENYQNSTKMNMYVKKEEAFWFNQLFHTFFNIWKDNPNFHHAFKRYLYRIYNKRRPLNLDTIYVDNVKLSGTAPFLKMFKEVDFERKSEFEFLYDVDVSYRGTLIIFLSTNLLIKIPYFNRQIKIPLICEFKVVSLTGIIRVYFNGTENAESWYAFLGEPLIDFDVNIIIGEETKIDINIATIKKFLIKMFRKNFRKYALPNKRVLTIPLTVDPKTLGVPEKVENPNRVQNQ